jgi:anti-sigma factor RsiW
MIHPVEELTAYLDGALTVAEQERVAQHLAGCASCRAEHGRLAGAVTVLRSLATPPTISPGFEQRFYARLASEKQSLRRRTLGERLGLRGAWRWLAPGLAGAVAAAVVLVYTGGQRRADEAFLASNLDLFESYEEVTSLDAIDSPEDVQVVAHLHELRDAGRPR